MENLEKYRFPPSLNKRPRRAPNKVKLFLAPEGLSYENSERKGVNVGRITHTIPTNDLFQLKFSIYTCKALLL